MYGHSQEDFLQQVSQHAGNHLRQSSGGTLNLFLPFVTIHSALARPVMTGAACSNSRADSCHLELPIPCLPAQQIVNDICGCALDGPDMCKYFTNTKYLRAGQH